MYYNILGPLYEVICYSGQKVYDINLDREIREITFQDFNKCDNTENIRFNFKFTEDAVVNSVYKISLGNLYSNNHSLYSSRLGNANCNATFCLDFTDVESRRKLRDFYLCCEGLYSNIEMLDFENDRKVIIEIKSKNGTGSFTFTQLGRETDLQCFFKYYQSLLFDVLDIPEEEKSYTTVSRRCNKITYVKGVYEYQISIVPGISAIHLDFTGCNLIKVVDSEGKTLEEQNIKLVFIFDNDDIRDLNCLTFEGIENCGALSIEFRIADDNNNGRFTSSLFMAKIYQLFIGKNLNMNITTKKGRKYICRELNNSEYKELLSDDHGNKDEKPVSSGQYKFSGLEKVLLVLVGVLVIIIVVLIINARKLKRY